VTLNLAAAEIAAFRPLRLPVRRSRHIADGRRRVTTSFRFLFMHGAGKRFAEP